MSLDDRIVSSALWAAYGDAIGFVSELADSGMLSKRTGSTSIDGLIKWKRRIGGFNGVFADFPVGTYSDDTQLRLATSRCINAAGYFDVESFAKIELTVWLSYCLGAGRGTKAAATNLKKTDANWFSNYYKSKATSYFDSGGNGAVMRIHPHVWAAVDGSTSSILLDVIKNTISTHGHLRAIVGACFHALFLKLSFQKKKVVEPADWRLIYGELLNIPSILREDMQLAAFWLPTWESNSNTKFAIAIELILEEIEADIAKLDDIWKSKNARDKKYFEALNCLGGFDPKQRGSGTKTALFASFLSLLYQDDPLGAMIAAANQLGSDTDTIATSAGAILGAIGNKRPDVDVQDQKYIEKEATRIAHLNSENSLNDFQYPDLLTWKAPKQLVDSILKTDSDLFIKGLGRARDLARAELIGKNPKLRWIWVQAAFGQTFLMRARKVIDSKTSQEPSGSYVLAKKQSKNGYGQRSLVFEGELKPIEPKLALKNEIARKGRTLNELTTAAIKSGFSAQEIGSTFIALIDEGREIEDVIAYAAIIAKARRVRK